MQEKERHRSPVSLDVSFFLEGWQPLWLLEACRSPVPVPCVHIQLLLWSRRGFGPSALWLISVHTSRA